jgi:hypothetical protein
MNNAQSIGAWELGLEEGKEGGQHVVCVAESIEYEMCSYVSM